MTHRDHLLPDGWKTIALISLEVRLDADGTPWTNQRDPVLRERIREVYRKLCESRETGRQIVAVHQEVIAGLVAMIEARTRANRRQSRRALREGRTR
jgi:hypothetical protein